MSRFFVLTLVSASLLAGCGSLNNRMAPEKLTASDLSSDSAIIIVSAGADKPCHQAATFLTIHEAGAPFNLRTIVETFNVDGAVLKSDFPDHQGNLSAVKIKAGNYYIAPHIANPNTKAVRTPIAEFSVAAGEVVYLGEFYVPVACGLSNQHVVRDQESRDLALLKQKNPAFANVKIIKRLVKYNSYVNGSLT
jgi:hypothetical protein